MDKTELKIGQSLGRQIGGSWRKEGRTIWIDIQGNGTQSSAIFPSHRAITAGGEKDRVHMVGQVKKLLPIQMLGDSMFS